MMSTDLSDAVDNSAVQGLKTARIADRNDDTEAAQTTPVSIPLNEPAESRNP